MRQREREREIPHSSQQIPNISLPTSALTTSHTLYPTLLQVWSHLTIHYSPVISSQDSLYTPHQPLHQSLHTIFKRLHHIHSHKPHHSLHLYNTVKTFQGRVSSKPSHLFSVFTMSFTISTKCFQNRTPTVSPHVHPTVSLLTFISHCLSSCTPNCLSPHLLPTVSPHVRPTVSLLTFIQLSLSSTSAHSLSSRLPNCLSPHFLPTVSLHLHPMNSP